MAGGVIIQVEIVKNQISEVQRQHALQLSTAKREFEAELRRLKEQGDRKLRLQRQDYEEILVAEQEVSAVDIMV